jgi:hypothetical protein
VPGTATTTKGSQWYFTVRPFDGADYGSLQTSATVTIQNNPPAASNLSLTPALPVTADNLVAAYVFLDADNDVESGSEVHWYKNGSLVPEMEGLLVVPASSIAAGDEWVVKVRPSDGEDFGPLVEPDPVKVRPRRIEAIGSFACNASAPGSSPWLAFVTWGSAGLGLRAVLRQRRRAEIKRSANTWLSP